MTANQPHRTFPYKAAKAWPENADFEMIFQKDTAYELGAGGKKSVNLTCVTSSPAFFTEDQVLLYGPDLPEIRGEMSYARICEILVKDEEAGGQASPGEENALGRGAFAAHKLLQDLEFVKFHVFPKGFMLRSSGQSPRETVRIGKKALQEGMSFERIGNAFIRHYKENPNVLAVRVIFVIGDGVDYEELQTQAKRTVEIRNSFSKIQKGLPTECSVCEIREICNEVEGLRKLHFGS